MADTIYDITQHLLLWLRKTMKNLNWDSQSLTRIETKFTQDNNIKIDLTEKEWMPCDCIPLGQDRN
jgi:hypothetical protein